MSPCAVCAGRGHIPCQFCGGRGTVGPDLPPLQGAAPPPPRKRAPSDDVLAGRWSGQQGGYYEFVKHGKQYTLTEVSALGPTGKGTATLSGKIVTMEISNMLLGQYTLQLQLEGDVLRGTLNVMGIAAPLVLTRG